MSVILRCFDPLTIPDAPFGLLFANEDLADGGEPTLLK